jgi:hypothetical protein
MQQINNSSWSVFTIAYAIDIAFGFDPEKSQYILNKCKQIYKTP